jgi:hypothetical protein
VLAGFAVAAVAAAVFADWPAEVAGQRAFVPHGLLGFGFGPHLLSQVFHLHGFQLVSWNVYVLPGLALFALLLAWAAIARRRTPHGQVPGHAGSVSKPGQPRPPALR